MQLRHLLGDDVFRKGVHNYRQVRVQERDAGRFYGSLGEAAGRDPRLDRQWLYRAGVNTIAADYSCANGRISSFALNQVAAGAGLPTLREQRVQVATFRLDGGKLVFGQSAAVTYNGAATGVPALVGSACPDLVYPNYQDWGFARSSSTSARSATAQASRASRRSAAALDAVAKPVGRRARRQAAAQ
jgi:aminopeptidase N